MPERPETPIGQKPDEEYDEDWHGVSCSKCKHDYLYSTKFERFVGRVAHAVRHPTHAFELDPFEQLNDEGERSPNYSHLIDDD